MMDDISKEMEVFEQRVATQNKSNGKNKPKNGLHEWGNMDTNMFNFWISFDPILAVDISREGRHNFSKDVCAGVRMKKYINIMFPGVYHTSLNGGRNVAYARNKIQ